MQQRQWTSRLYFLAAAIGSAVGISNIWKFTYVAGENGGGAFILIYIVALACIALPALIAEFSLVAVVGKVWFAVWIIWQHVKVFPEIGGIMAG